MFAADAPLEEGDVAEGAVAEDPLPATVVGDVELVAPFKQPESPGLDEIDESIKGRQHIPPV